MKKILKLLFIMLIPILITSCSQKDYKEGQLIEISGIELTNNFAGENAKNFIFAIVNETKPGYKEFLSDLERYAKETNKAIYFTYYNHLDTEAAFYIFNLYEADFTSNGYHVLEDGKLTVTTEYTNYNNMKATLEEKRFYTILDYTSEKQVQETLKLAQEEYDKGNISISYNYINKIWNRKEAKDFYKNHPKLGIIKSWEHFTITKDKRDRITYRSLLFHHNTNYFLEILTKEYYDGFEKPQNMLDYEQVFYYVKDDIIYTSDKEDGTYKERFKIKKIENTSIKLFDYKYKKDYIFTRRVG
jgi:hypothetical protein